MDVDFIETIKKSIQNESGHSCPSWDIPFHLPTAWWKEKVNFCVMSLINCREMERNVPTWKGMSQLVLEYSLVKQFRSNGFFFIVSMKSTSMCTTWNKFHVHEWIFYPGHQGFKIFRFSKMLKKKLFFYSKSIKGYLISYKSKKSYQNY